MTTPETTPTRDEAMSSYPNWPEYLMIRDTGLHDDQGGLGQRIYTTAGAGYKKVRYVRGDIASAPAPASGRVDAVLNLYREAVRVDVKMEGPQFMGANSSALKRAWEADRASLSPAATPVSEAEPVERGDLIDGLDDLARRMPASADKLLLSEAIGLIQSLAKPASSPAGGEVRRVRHKKRGTTYRVLHGAVMQSTHWRDTHYKVPADGRTVVVYQSEDDGSVWVRPAEEFEDGRFEALSQSASAGRVGE